MKRTFSIFTALFVLAISFCMTSCTKEKDRSVANLSLKKAATEMPTNVSNATAMDTLVIDSLGMAERKEPGCLTNVGVQMMGQHTVWQGTVYYTNTTPGRKIILIVIKDATNKTIYRHQIPITTKTPKGEQGSVAFDVPANGSGKWVLTYSVYIGPVKNNMLCSSASTELFK